MDTLKALLDHLKDVKGAYQVSAIALVGAVISVFVFWPIAAGMLGLGVVSYAFGLVTSNKEISLAPEINPARGNLFAVADDHVPHNRPDNVTEWDWILFRHLKVGPEIAIARDGSIPAKYFLDLREAALIPSQCEVLSDALCTTIRNAIDVHNHHAVIIPKSGNANLGMAVARELGLAPILVRDWPYYGRWVETLLSHGRAILVDDVTALGEILIDAATHARDAGFVVSRAFVLVIRKEGSAVEMLEEQRLSLTSAHEMSDDDFESIVGRVRGA